MQTYAKQYFSNEVSIFSLPVISQENHLQLLRYIIQKKYKHYQLFRFTKLDGSLKF